MVPITNNDNGGGGNGGGGNGGGNGLPCNPDSIYFQQQILPFLVSNCAKSGCHDAATAEDGVILDSYVNVMNTGEVTPFDLNDSKLWEVITTTDPDDKMPPAGEPQLNQQQIAMIAQWINQGAQNLVCDDELGPCDSTGVSYLATVKPIMQNKCVGCHTTGNSTNGFVNLSSYAGVQATAQSGALVGSIIHNPMYAAMPKNGPSLSTCEIGKIRNWVAEGALNN
ncbi:MAG: c-type cytochrome [Bacteroidetes bacterium]|nr:c-type cytochrome [Bacteroidota bacterium]